MRGFSGKVNDGALNFSESKMMGPNLFSGVKISTVHLCRLIDFVCKVCKFLGRFCENSQDYRGSSEYSFILWDLQSVPKYIENLLTGPKKSPFPPKSMLKMHLTVRN